MKAGCDYIGVGVGAIVLDAGRTRVFLAERGSEARNERGCWEFPGGGVHFGERTDEAIVREFAEEYGMEIEVESMLGAFDHLLPGEGQHWLSVTYLARHVGGTPAVREPHKCSAIGWFRWDELPEPMSMITRQNLVAYQERTSHSAGVDAAAR